jgi:DNA recombination protein RmuC
MLVGLLIGLVVGAAGAWLLLRTRSDDLTARFNALAADALRQNNETFLDIAADKLSNSLGQGEQAVARLVQPLKESLTKVAEQAEALERSRRQDYGSLHTSLQNLVQTNDQVRAETARLATALRSSEVRGAWGQMQLRNAVETAGMLAYCDFEEEVHTVADGRTMRPDMVVRLPGNRRIVIDAKTPLKALLDATTAPEEQQPALVADYARHVREHVRQLSSKSYWDQLEGTPDYVVMFLPGEGFFRTAVEADPSLLGTGGNDRVILASPMMLIALLRLVGSVWNEEKVAESAREVNRLGQELYERLSKFTQHVAGVGRGIETAAKSYNDAVGSLENRVLPSARKFREHGVVPTAEIAELKVIETTLRPVTAPERPAANADAA